MNSMPGPGPMDSPQPGDARFSSAAARPSGPAGTAEQPFFRLDLKRSLHLHRRLAAGIALAGLVLAAISFALKWPTYLAQSQVFIQPAAPQIMAAGGRTNWPNDTNSYDTVVQQQMQAVSHPNVRLSALRKLGSGAFQRPGEDEQAASIRLGKAIDAKRLATSYQIEISAHAKDPELAAKMANAMALSLVENAARQEKSGDTERLAVLTAEQTQIQKELAADRAEQEALNAKLGTASIGSATNHYDQDIASIREELVKARAARDEAAARLSTMEAMKGATPLALNAEADEMAATDAGLVSMKTSLNQRRAVLIAQMANLSASHPLYKQDAAELTQIDASLEAMQKDLRAKVSARIAQRLHTDLDRTTAVQDRLNGQLSQLAAAAAGATPQLQRAADLATSIARLQSRFTVVDEQVRDLTLQTNAPGSVYLSALASAPTRLAWMLILKRPLIFALGGIFLAMLAALIANNLDPTIYIAADVTRVLGYAPMAQLPDFTEVSPGVAEDHMLRLSSAIDHASRQGNLKSCIFTAVGPGGGSTTIATRVHAILHAMGRDSVLVDARGAVVKSAPATGNGKSTSTALTTTERGSLSSPLIQHLAQEVRSEESLVLTDTAPLAISAETEYLARHVDAVIVVIESGVTTRPQLQQAAESLQRLDVAAVGFVLNKVGIATADAPFLHTVQAMEQLQGGQSRSVFHPMGIENKSFEVPHEDKVLQTSPSHELPSGVSAQTAPENGAAPRLGNAENGNRELPREGRRLQQTTARELAGGGAAAAEPVAQVAPPQPPPARSAGMTAASGDSAPKQSTARELPAQTPPARVPATPPAAAAPLAPQTDSAPESKLDRTGAQAATDRPAAVSERAEDISQKPHPDQNFVKGQPAWTRQPQPRHFEPKAAAVPVQAKKDAHGLTITERPLSPRERQEVEAARLKAHAMRAQASAPVPQAAATRLPAQTQVSNPVPPSAQARPAQELQQEPVPLPVGRPIEESAPSQNQGQGRLDEWVNLRGKRSSIPEEVRPVAATREDYARNADSVETPKHPDSPLSGLRDHALGQALRDLHRLARPEPEPVFLVEPYPERKQAAVPAHDDSPSLREPVMVKASVRPAAARVHVPMPEPVRSTTAPTLVTANPEILPPKPDTATQARESKLKDKIDRRDRRETFDDVEVLPSWRGQYKKR